MAAILRDRINDLLIANADLEREVARLRYADAGKKGQPQLCLSSRVNLMINISARGAAESVETLNKLRETRDTLNEIFIENDQLKIEVIFFLVKKIHLTHKFPFFTNIKYHICCSLPPFPPHIFF